MKYIPLSASPPFRCSHAVHRWTRAYDEARCVEVIDLAAARQLLGAFIQRSSEHWNRDIGRPAAWGTHGEITGQGPREMKGQGVE